MDPKSINNLDSNDKVVSLKKEIQQLERQINQLQGQIAVIQKDCCHHFKESHMMRKCLKCDFTESAYF